MTSTAEGSAFGQVDLRPRHLLERYVSMVGGSIAERTKDLVEVALPPAEAPHFGGKATFSIAFTPEELEDGTEAEILVNGSLLLRNLVEAIQARGALLYRGEVVPTLPGAEAPPTPPVELSEVSVVHATATECFRPVGRLLVKLTIHAGPAMLEKMVETAMVDLVSGARPESSVVAELAAANTAPPASQRATLALPCKVETMLKLLTDDLSVEASDELQVIQREAESALNSELARLAAYYDAMLDEAEDSGGSDDVKERKAAIRADRNRRSKEEKHRHTVRVSVHPIQLTQWDVPAQEVRWQLRALSGTEGVLTAARTLVGTGPWQLHCPSCGAKPRSINVCRHGHACCEGCADVCSACGEACCSSHGGKPCAIEPHFLCDVHAATCRVCERVYCAGHNGLCEKHDHEVCSYCAVACSRCGIKLCTAHATASSPTAPLRQRWLCSECTVFCEGGQNEPVGLDEVTRCATCTAYICAVHEARCAVDGKVHCSKHLRRSDRSGAIVCTAHRASCADEPHSVFASTEVRVCSTCGRVVCESHSGTCAADNESHCTAHLRSPRAQLEIQLCENHRGTCTADDGIYRLEDLKSCPVCGNRYCKAHRVACRHCGRMVCTGDLPENVCRTCARLAPCAEPDEQLISGALAANRGEPPGLGNWRTARDAEHTVVEIDHGWSRRLVFTVPHQESTPSTVLKHSVLGSKRLA